MITRTKFLNSDQTQLVCSQPENQYRLASLYQVFFARLFDLVISSIPGIILRVLVTINPGQWQLMIGILFTGLGFIFIYFMFVPYLLNGNTLGKLIFGISLKQKGKKKVSFWALFWRETYFMFVPWLVSVILQIIAIVIMSPYANNDSTGWAPTTKVAILLTQLGYIFYAVWLIFISATIIVQNQHQAVVDLKFNLFVVKRKPINLEQSEEKKNDLNLLKRDDPHISLSEQPGNFSLEQIQELYLDNDVTTKQNLHFEEINEIDEMLIEQNKNLITDNKTENEGKTNE